MDLWQNIQKKWEGIMILKIIMLVVFFAIMIGVGFYSRKQATDVNGFVLGGRSVGPWLTAFAYGTYRADFRKRVEIYA